MLKELIYEMVLEMENQDEFMGHQKPTEELANEIIEKFHELRHQDLEPYKLMLANMLNQLRSIK